MPRGFPALSRTLTGLITGALILTSVGLAAAPATATTEPVPDQTAALESALAALPAPPGPAPDPVDRAVRPDAVEEIAPLERTAGGAPIGPLAEAPAPAERSAADAELVADGATLSGTVVDSAGAPIAGIDVMLNGLDDGSRVAEYRAVTAADGTWSLSDVEAAADVWYLSFGDPEGRFAWQNWDGATWYRMPTTLELSPGDVLEGMDATLFRIAEISGTISGGHAYFGQVNVSASLYAYDWDFGDWVNVGWSEAIDGKYSFSALAPDYYVIAAHYESNRGWGYAVSDVQGVAEGDSLTVDLSVRREDVGPNHDFSGDWIPDVLAITTTGSLRMYRGDAGGGWLGASSIGSGWSGMNTVFQAGDFSGDGHTDVIARDGSGNLLLYRGDGAGGWAGSAKIGTGWGAFTSIFAPGDFDGDGNVDVMARDRAGALYLYRGDGNGGWLDRLTVGSGWQGFTALVGIGDFDGNWTPDVIARDGSGRLWLYPGNGTGSWLTPRQIGSGFQGFTAMVGGGDLWNNDGAPELVVRDAVGNLRAYPGNGVGGWVGMGLGVHIGNGWNGLRIVG